MRSNSYFSIVNVVGVLLFFFFIFTNIGQKISDGTILLEYSCPQLFYLINDAYKCHCYNAVTAESESHLALNYCSISKSIEGKYDNFEIKVSEEGVIEYKGCNKGDDVVLWVSNLVLPEGKYWILDQEHESSIDSNLYFYIQGITNDKDRKRNTVGKLPNDNVFMTEYEKYSQYQMLLKIPAGFQSEHCSFKIIIIPYEEEKIWSPSTVVYNESIIKEYTGHQVIQLLSNSMCSIKRKDFNYLKNYTKYVAKGYKWITFVNEFGYGIEFERENNKYIAGQTDALGRVYEIEQSNLLDLLEYDTFIELMGKK